MSVNDICDELAELIEPDPGARDDGRMRPFGGFDPDTLYIWPVRERFDRMGTRDTSGAIDREAFVIHVAWVTDKRGEVDDIDREVSDTVVGHASALAAIIRANPGGGARTYANVVLEEVDYQALTGYENRGYLARLTGWVEVN